MTRPDWPKVIHETAVEAVRQALERRELVLRHPDLAARLTALPTPFSRPENWNGYIPPYMVPGNDRHVHNTSAQRVHLVAICREAIARAYGEEVGRQWLTAINFDYWSQRWTPHHAIEVTPELTT